FIRAIVRLLTLYECYIGLL
ncbi:hypothetical protein D018_3706B, partial [Vibrio parahaemolyticus VP2007-007]